MVGDGFDVDEKPQFTIVGKTRNPRILAANVVGYGRLWMLVKQLLAHLALMLPGLNRMSHGADFSVKLAHPPSPVGQLHGRVV